MTVAAAPPPDAYAIFQRTRSAVSGAAYPRRLDYTVAISGFDGDTFRENHYRASYESNDGTIREFPMSDEESASPPPIPHGITLRIQGMTIGRAPPSADVMGVPLLAPTYAFGLQFPQPQHAPQSDSPATSLPTIAVVSTKTRDYAVTLVDVPLLDGVATYHLKLTPLRKPNVNRLRELWVDASNYLPRQAVVAGNFTDAPLTNVPWTISFATFDGAPVIACEKAETTLYLPHRRVVRGASIAFVNLHEPSGSPVGEPLVEPQVEGGALLEPPS
jgi:hypothetical protein